MIKITPEMVAEAAARYRSGESMMAIARDMGVTDSGLRDRLRKSGVAARINYKSTLTRFWSMVKITSSDGCWEWTGYISIDGYGTFKADGKIRKAHRVSYELFIGEIPEGLQIDHLCRNRRCVHPYHMEPVTYKENQLRGIGTIAVVNSAKTHCPAGHEYSVANTRYFKSGSRACIECSRIASRAKRAKAKLKREQK